MIRTYIYGIPHGFNFYEGDTEYLEYFKAFYISSRRGMRMVVNRRENGETIYSYLRYGMREVERQPLHAFFGMSIVIDNYEYCADFKTLLGWFDTIFEKFVNEHGVIKVDTDGSYRYQVHRFEEGLEDVAWLKNNLPNIITKSNKTTLHRYDDTFSDGITGQVASYGQTVTNAQILAALKKYKWVSLSSEISNHPVAPAAVQPVIELNYLELNNKLNELNKETLAIAVDNKKGSADVMRRISEEVTRNVKSIKDYLHTTSDEQEADRFDVLDKGYSTLLDQVNALSKKYPDVKEPPKVLTQYCYSCKLEKPLSEFASPNATVCRTCAEKYPPPPAPEKTKRCVKCHRTKPLEQFSNKQAEVCLQCEKGTTIDWKKYLVPGGIAIAAAAIIALVILLPGWIADGHGSFQDEPTERLVMNEDQVDREKFSVALERGDFAEVYACIQDKDDANQYYADIKEAVDAYLLYLIDSQENPYDVVRGFWTQNEKLLQQIGFGDNEKAKWVDYCQKYQQLRLYVYNYQTLTDEQIKDANSIVDALFPEESREVWITRINAKRKPVRQAVVPATPPEPVYILTYTKAATRKKTTVRYRPNEGNVGVDALEGTDATVKAPAGEVVKETGNAKMTVTAATMKAQTMKCTDSLVITITGVAKETDRE